ncbi:uncharacterized protein LOC133175095 [Saccostrea echinata]|uniref:uncharacterized protein LOC133175095 n=1 Tax=Saccostrea echinata TaxID=191078 RepID=UPI002A8353DD|nr:uncharacterized protein LOC133175095 [Saccostrea echinata]
MMTKIQKKKLLLASSNVLTDFLKNYSKAGQQIHCLDEYTTQLTKQAITAMKTGNKGKALQLLKHRCVADGIKHMYRQYRQLKWTQARRLALSVASTINPNLPLPHRPHDNQEGVEEIQVEKYAQTMMVAQCNFSRNS